MLEISKEIHLEINVEETEYMFIHRHQNAGRKCNIKITNKLWKCGQI
jgi:hypothetical protein